MRKMMWAASASFMVLLVADQAGAQVAAPPVAAEPTAEVPQEDAASPEEVQDVIVTGSRLRSGFAAPTPVQVLSGDLIASQRAPTQIGDVLNETPAFLPTGGASQGQFGTSSVGQSTVNLRGLGNVRTLVLVDGRRPVGTQLSGVFDVNLIPAGLIDRIDVVTGGASAAYGSDAVAGVVNFVLKSNLDGLKGTISAGLAEEGDGAEYNASLSYGGRFLDNRLKILIGADYTKGEGIDSLYSRDWGRREPGIFAPASPRAAGVPAQIIGENIEIRNPPGGVINNGPLRGTAFGTGGVPYAYQFGNPLGTTEQQGTSNYGFSRLGNQYIRGPFERYSGLGRIDFDISDALTVFVEGSYGKLDPRSRTTYFNFSNLVISTQNPYVPESVRSQLVAAGQTSFQLGRVLSDLGPVSTNSPDDTWRGAIGLRGKIGRSLSWDAYYEQGQSNLNFNITNMLVTPNFLASVSAVRDANGAIVCAPVASNPNLSAVQRTQVDPGCQPYNLFGPNSVSAAARDYVTAPILARSRLTQDVAAVNLRGDAFALPAGPVSFAVGFEHRATAGVDSVSAETLRYSTIGAYAASNRAPSSGEITVNEGYAEVDLPILKDAAFARSLSVNGAIRYTDYSTSGSVTTWKAGVVYEPTDWLRIRGTRSRDIRAPNIAELFGNAPEGFTNQTNPITGASAQIRTQAISNPDLAPEIASTYTVGAVLQPSGLGDFKLSVDYYNITVDGVIGSVSASEVLRRYYVLGQTAEYGRYIEFVPTSQNITGFQKVSSPIVNAASLATDGVDVEMVYKFGDEKIGNFTISALGSWLSRFTNTDISGVIDSAGGSIPDTRVTANFTYQRSDFSTNLQVRYNSGRKYSDTVVGPEDAGYNPASPVSINKNWFPSAVYLTLSANYNITDASGRKLQLFGVVNNLLDTDPPFGSYALVSTASSSVNYYDFVGRTYRVGARFEF